ncbi:hypothetical protein [Streptomyces aureus]
MTQPPIGQNGTWPDLSAVQTKEDFRDALDKLRELKNLTDRQVAEASDDGSGRKLTTTKISTVRKQYALPAREFVIKFLCGCGLRTEVEQSPWLTCWERLRDDKPAPVNAQRDEKPTPADGRRDEKPAPAGERRDEKPAPADGRREEEPAPADGRRDDKQAPPAAPGDGKEPSPEAPREEQASPGTSPEAAPDATKAPAQAPPGDDGPTSPKTPQGTVTSPGQDPSGVPDRARTANTVGSGSNRTRMKDEPKRTVVTGGQPPSSSGRKSGWKPSTTLLKVLAGVTVLLVVAALAGWAWHYKTVADDRLRDAKNTQEEKQKFKKQHCGTLNSSLVTADGECTGVTDGSDGAAVFGDDLKPVMTAIGAENRNVVESGDYVTVAFLAPLASKSANSLTFGQYVAELEGAYTAVEEENRKNSRPKIRLVVANMGSSEKQWAGTVGLLTTMKKDDRLVAVAGLGLSQGESVQAARALSKADLPMVGDLITADGFDSTGTVDHKGAIDGLARVALPNRDQLTALSKDLGTARRNAALIRTGLTPNGSKDLYTESLNQGFQGIEGLKKNLDDSADFRFDPRGGPGTSMTSISEDLCHSDKKIDTIYYAGRVKYLPDLLDGLATRSCHTEPITVVAGSDTAGFDPGTKSLHVGDAPITVLYANFRNAAQLRSPDNPARNLYEDFARDFTARHHGQRFDADHLTDTYWSLVAHDAVLTAATAVHRAGGHGALPNRYAVGNELFALRNDAVAGATGHFGIDKNGNRTDTSRVVTVHQLGHPLPETPENDS